MNWSITPNHISVSIIKDNKLAIAELSILPELMYVEGKQTAYFSRINVPKQITKQGIGSQLLDALLKYCLENKIAICCDVNPYGDMTKQQLIDWYIRHGFEYKMRPLITDKALYFNM